MGLSDQQKITDLKPFILSTQSTYLERLFTHAFRKTKNKNIVRPNAPASFVNAGLDNLSVRLCIIRIIYAIDREKQRGMN